MCSYAQLKDKHGFAFIINDTVSTFCSVSFDVFSVLYVQWPHQYFYLYIHLFAVKCLSTSSLWLMEFSMNLVWIGGTEGNAVYFCLSSVLNYDNSYRHWHWWTHDIGCVSCRLIIISSQQLVWVMAGWEYYDILGLDYINHVCAHLFKVIQHHIQHLEKEWVFFSCTSHIASLFCLLLVSHSFLRLCLTFQFYIKLISPYFFLV